MRTFAKAVFLASLLVFGAASFAAAPPATRPAPPVKPQLIKTESGKDYDHKPSGFTFPFNVGAFCRAGVYQFDKIGQNISVGYSDPSLKIILTAYVYPATNIPPDQHFKQMKADVLKVNPKAKLIDEGGINVEQGKKIYEGQRARYAIIGMLDGAEQDLITEAYLFVHAGQFVKYRLTYQATQQKAAGPRVEFFMKSLPFPQFAATKPTK